MKQPYLKTTPKLKFYAFSLTSSLLFKIFLPSQSQNPTYLQNEKAEAKKKTIKAACMWKPIAVISLS
jgi:hypothetical protein